MQDTITRRKVVGFKREVLCFPPNFELVKIMLPSPFSGKGMGITRLHPFSGKGKKIRPQRGTYLKHSSKLNKLEEHEFDQPKILASNRNGKSSDPA
jgi:hypothetical protein